MDYITWCGLFKIGHPIIDEQHQKLLKIVNKFHRQMQIKDNTLLITGTLNSLIKYVEFHFDEEIKILQKKGYPDDELKKHEEIHDSLVQDIFKLNEQFCEGKYGSLIDVEKFLTDWLVMHVLHEDMKFKYHLKER